MKMQKSDIWKLIESPLFALAVLSTLWLQADRAFSAEEYCSTCGYKVAVSGDFKHHKAGQSIAIQGAGNNEAAFREEVYGEDFSAN
jgi:hypothetical protein